MLSDAQPPACCPALPGLAGQLHGALCTTALSCAGRRTAAGGALAAEDGRGAAAATHAGAAVASSSAMRARATCSWVASERFSSTAWRNRLCRLVSSRAGTAAARSSAAVLRERQGCKWDCEGGTGVTASWNCIKRACLMLGFPFAPGTLFTRQGGLRRGSAEDTASAGGDRCGSTRPGAAPGRCTQRLTSRSAMRAASAAPSPQQHTPGGWGIAAGGRLDDAGAIKQ